MHCQLGQMERAVKGLAEFEKRCQNMRQEVNLLSERQEIFRGMVENKNRLQSRTTENITNSFCTDEGAGRKVISTGSATCAEKYDL